MKKTITLCIAVFLFTVSFSQTVTTNNQKGGTTAAVINNYSDKQTDKTIKIIKSFDSQVNDLLLQYYKAGYMDAQNAIIGLINQNSLFDSTVENERRNHWYIIEIKLKSNLKNNK